MTLAALVKVQKHGDPDQGEGRQECDVEEAHCGSVGLWVRGSVSPWVCGPYVDGILGLQDHDA